MVAMYILGLLLLISIAKITAMLLTWFSEERVWSPGEERGEGRGEAGVGSLELLFKRSLTF